LAFFEIKWGKVRDAAWRDLPPTEKQIELCERWGLAILETKGEAADIITLAIAEWAFRRFGRWGGPCGWVSSGPWLKRLS